MGAWGHGVYDNDDALDIVSDFLEFAGANNNKEGDRMIPLANNTIHTGEWIPSEGKLHQIVIEQLHSNFKDIERNVIQKNLAAYDAQFSLEGGEDEAYHKDLMKSMKGVQYLVLCDILQRHGYNVPNSSAKRAYKAISYLLSDKCENTSEYDNPNARKISIKSVLSKIAEQGLDVSAKSYDSNSNEGQIIKKDKRKNNLKK